MNIHPLFVHFPIAMFVLYSILEIGAYIFSGLRRRAWIFPVKVFLLFVGVLAAFATLITGAMAQDLVRDINPRSFILSVHAPFAMATTLLYLILASAYCVRIFDIKGWGNRVYGNNSFLLRIWSAKKYYIAHLILDTWLLPVLALIALIGITITGALGAAIVFGADSDPFVSLVYHLFWAE